MGSKGRPYRTLIVDGFEVLVGRGDEENDVLTFEVADPQDFWLHVAGGVPGSHVVIRNPEKLDALPAPVVEAAAALAAWHSKARGRRRVEVHLCRVADVGKAKGAPAGEVVLRRWERVRVAPAYTGRQEPS
jgi:predicted ribosome quality control (RQC) complex YloA/Tae2 family protein